MTLFRRPQLMAQPLHYAERSSAPCNVAQRVGGGNGGEGRRRRRAETGEAAVTKGSRTKHLSR
jgi:hypothetical protein